MTMLTTEEIVRATGGELLSENAASFAGVSIDSRSISDGEIFFALRGQNFDGHNFLDDALLRGDGAVIDSKDRKLPEGKVIVYVRDTLKALQDLAHSLRAKSNVPVVAITGSNGKTTTKEMTYEILSGRFRVLSNKGNLNNHIGLPLSLTGLDIDDEAVVLELGMNSTGEIRRLCEIAEPTHGIITNIGMAHIGKLGSLDLIRSAKFEILQGLTVAVLNADDDFLMEGFKSVVANGGFMGRVITFSINPVKKSLRDFLSDGVNNGSHVTARDVYTTEKGNNFILELNNGKSAAIKLNIHGLFNVYNALAASAVCLSLGINIDEIKTALENYSSFPQRFEVINGGTITLINDSYNANPSSMAESLRELVRMKGDGRTVAVLGDMFELGEFSEKQHRAIGKIITNAGIDVFIAVGEMMGFAVEESKSLKGVQPATYGFKTINEAEQNITGIIRSGDLVLVKGSRSMDMEKILEGLGIRKVSEG